MRTCTSVPQLGKGDQTTCSVLQLRRHPYYSAGGASPGDRQEIMRTHTQTQTHTHSHHHRHATHSHTHNPPHKDTHTYSACTRPCHTKYPPLFTHTHTTHTPTHTHTTPHTQTHTHTHTVPVRDPATQNTPPPSFPISLHVSKTLRVEMFESEHFC